MPKSKQNSTVLELAQIKTTLATNVTNRMNRLYRKLPNETERLKAVSKKALPHKIGKTTIKRYCNLDEPNWPKMDKIIALAKGLELEPYQLLIHNLDPANPQIAVHPTKREYALYGKMGTAPEEVDAE